MVARLQTAGFYLCDERVERHTTIFSGVVLVARWNACFAHRHQFLPKIKRYLLAATACFRRLRL
jgi:hypothetical protein